MNNEVFEQSLSDLLKKQYRLNIELACFSSGYIPKYVLLDRTRNIHSYIVFCRKEKNDIISSFWEQGKLINGLVDMLKAQFSKLDRPLFFIIQENEKVLKVIEGNYIREELLRKSNINIENFLLSESVNFQDIILNIKSEL